MRHIPLLVFLLALVAGLAAAPRHLISRVRSDLAGSSDFVHFESGHVHPAAMTPSGGRLLVVNTPDNRLSVFDLTGGAPVRIADIAVGLEPVSVAAVDDSTAWVVNHLSDNISVVNLNTLHVRAALTVGDEPSDVVFAGGNAYVSVSQEDVVKVYDTATLAPVGVPIAIQGRMPRALAVSADGSRVYAAVLHAGNRTSVLSFAEANDSLPPPNPPMSGSLPAPPDVALIVQQQGNDWRDESGKLWNAKIKYSLAEVDVAEIATSTRTVVASHRDMGTVNLGLAASADGRLALTNTEARNLVRFEPNQRGHTVDTRLSIVSGGVVTNHNLNPHINYSVTPGPASEADSAIGTPTGVAWSGNSQRTYVTSLASDRLAVLATPAAGAATILARVPTAAGPTGVVVDDARGRIYVVGRTRNELQTLRGSNFTEVARAWIGFDPTPDEIVNGRKFFYGGFTSGHGDQSCASCHVFGDLDNIAWDLGDPQGAFQPKPPGQIDPFLSGFHPMKGPMTTQSLRGLPGTFLLHWRGDRADLNAFNAAFVGLMGRAVPLPDSEMAAFNDFVLPLVNPPNPNQFLDRSFRDAPAGVASARRGRIFYFNSPVDGGATCNSCHAALNFGPGTNGQLINRVALQGTQDIKIPHTRNMYRKTGFTDAPGAVNKRGFGFTHDGAIDNLFNFLKFPGFSFAGGVTGDNQRRDVEAFLLAFDTGMAPAVGFQIGFLGGASNTNPVGVARLDTLKRSFDSTWVDLVAHGRLAGQSRGWTYQGGDQWKPDKSAEPNVTSAVLRSLGGAGSEVVVMGVPRGSGARMGVDRDRDGFLDGDELDAGSDPGNPASTPANVAVEPARELPRDRFGALGPNPFRTSTALTFALAGPGRVDVAVFDVLGREVRSLARGTWLAAGAQRFAWDGRDGDGRETGAGVYFVRVKTPMTQWTRAVVRVR
ncbi:MAG: FlgD immunoglobulin-like domain containing protein, partial [Candidatus Eisenbacteria bacterium]